MTHITRRTLLTGAAALGAAAMLGGCAPQTLEENEQLSSTEGTEKEPVVEVKHAWCKMCGPARTHCSTLCTIKDGRWTHVEGNPEAGNNYGRGSKTWDQALDEIAAKLKEQKEQYGAESYGVLSPQYYAVLGDLGRRFLNVHGSPNYLHSAICNSQRMFSRLVTLGGPHHFGAPNTAAGQPDKTKLLVARLR